MIDIKKERILLEPKEIKPTSKDFEIIGTLNPAAIRLPNGEILLYVRVIERLKKIQDKLYVYSPRMVGRKEFKVTIDRFRKKDIKDNSEFDIHFNDNTKRLTFISHFRRVVLDKTGFRVLSIEQKPSFYGLYNDGELGVEDPRITRIGDFYVMTYVSLSRKQNISTSLAFSYDCYNWSREGIIFGEQDKDVVIFPEKVKGRYVAFDRPEGNFQFSPPHIWIAYSHDLKSWGDLKPIDCVYEERGVCPRNGAGPPPIKTDKGWLLLFHTVTIGNELKKTTKREMILLKLVKRLFKKSKDKIQSFEKNILDESGKQISFYSVGAALFDLENPEKLIARSKSLLIVPDKKHYQSFEDKRVVFPTGIVIDNNNKDILVYSGGGDIVTTVKKIELKLILNSLEKFDEKS